jgi:hypothetical protein
MWQRRGQAVATNTLGHAKGRALSTGRISPPPPQLCCAGRPLHGGGADKPSSKPHWGAAGYMYYFLRSLSPLVARIVYS